MKGLTLEALLTSHAAFGLTTATALQRAICRASEGRPTGLSPEDLQRYFGGAEPTSRPKLVELICGVRSGKTVMAGAAALYCALTADLSGLRPGERARVPIVAPTIDNATQTFELLIAAIENAPALKALVVPTPKGRKKVELRHDDAPANTVTIRRDDGRLVSIVVVAARRGAVTMRSRWLAGFVIEEVAFFGADQAGYVINAEAILRAGETRLRPGGQGWIISSPMGPEGLLHSLYERYFGKPGRALVVKAPTLAMNPVTVSAEDVEAYRKEKPDEAAMEYDAEFGDPDSQFIPSQHIDSAIRKGPRNLPPEAGLSYVAAMDPATRGNAWTLVVATRAVRDGRVKSVVAFARQWVGSKKEPLSPDAVLKEQAGILIGYGLKICSTDQHSADANRDIAKRYGLHLYDVTATHASNLEMYESLRTKLADGDVEFPNEPVLRADLLAIRKKVGTTVSIVLPRTPDGRHADFAPAVARAIAEPCRNPVMQKPPKTAEDEQREMFAAAKKRARLRERAADRQTQNWGYWK